MMCGTSTVENVVVRLDEKTEMAASEKGKVIVADSDDYAWTVLNMLSIVSPAAAGSAVVRSF